MIFDRRSPRGAVVEELNDGRIDDERIVRRSAVLERHNISTRRVVGDRREPSLAVIEEGDDARTADERVISRSSAAKVYTTTDAVSNHGIPGSAGVAKFHRPEIVQGRIGSRAAAPETEQAAGLVGDIGVARR